MKYNKTQQVEVYIYSRKSRYTGTGESIENQIEMCKEYAQRIFPDNCNFHIYEDEGYSAKNVERPQWQRLMRELEQGSCHVLMCYRLDRISRSVSDFSTILDFLTDKEIDFISVRENFDTTTPMGRAMIYIASVFAQLERETITERIRDNKFRLYRTGRWQGGTAPVGFKAVKTLYLDDDGSKRHMYVLEAEPKNQEHVKFIFNKFLELGSLSAIESFLLENHIATINNNDYSKSVIRQILVNPVYTNNEAVVFDYLSSQGCDIVENRDSFDGKLGLIAYARTVSKGIKNTVRSRNQMSNWIIATGVHQGLITGAQWVKIQQIIKKNAEKYPRAESSNVALLSTLIRCANCGSPMIVKGNRENAAGEKTFYYKCRKKDQTHSKLCSVNNIKGLEFDRYVVSLLNTQFSEGGDISKTFKKSFNYKEAEKSNYISELKKLEKQIADNGDASVKLAGKMAYTQSDAEDKAIRQAICELADKTTQLTIELNSVKQKLVGSSCEVVNIEMMKKAIELFTESFDSMSLEVQKANIKLIIKRITWDGENSKIELFPDAVYYGKKKTNVEGCISSLTGEGNLGDNRQ